MAVYSYIVTEGQSLVDVCIQETGGLNNLVKLCADNGLSPTALLSPGQELMIDDALVERPDVVRYLASRGRVNTGQNDVLSEISALEFTAVLTWTI